jgi:hypothetical protein
MLKVRSFDSLTRYASNQTLDTILTAATDEELATYMAGRAKLNPGKVWDGYFKVALDAMDKATRDEVLSNLAEYEPSEESGEMESGPSGSLASTGDEKEDGEKNPDGSIGKGKPNSTKDTLRGWRDQSGSVIDAMNKANAKFWKK